MFAAVARESRVPSLPLPHPNELRAVLARRGGGDHPRRDGERKERVSALLDLAPCAGQGVFALPVRQVGARALSLSGATTASPPQ